MVNAALPGSRWRCRQSYRVKNNVTHELLELDDQRADAPGGLPPPVRIEARMARPTDGNNRLRSPHVASQHALHAARMIPGRYEDKRFDLMLATPCWKYLADTFGPGIGSGD